jgi:hypothetical protein
MRHSLSLSLVSALVVVLLAGVDGARAVDLPPSLANEILVDDHVVANLSCPAVLGEPFTASIAASGPVPERDPFNDQFAEPYPGSFTARLDFSGSTVPADESHFGIVVSSGSIQFVVESPVGLSLQRQRRLALTREGASTSSTSLPISTQRSRPLPASLRRPANSSSMKVTARL